MAKPGSKTLLLAGLAAAVGIALAAAALTIMVIAAIRPPISEYGRAELNAQLARNARTAWPLPLFTLLCCIAALAEVILRRPLLGRREPVREWHLSNTSLLVFAGLGVVAVAFAASSTRFAIRAIATAGDTQITDSPSFGGIGLNLATLTIICFSASSLLFRRWFYAQDLPRPDRSIRAV